MGDIDDDGDSEIDIVVNCVQLIEGPTHYRRIRERSPSNQNSQNILCNFNVALVKYCP